MDGTSLVLLPLCEDLGGSSLRMTEGLKEGTVTSAPDYRRNLAELRSELGAGMELAPEAFDRALALIAASGCVVIEGGAVARTGC